VNPWSLAFLPEGTLLVTEKEGRLRIVRNGVLDPKPVPGVPTVRVQGRSGLLDVLLHPQFAANRFIYFTYLKPVGAERQAALTVARGRFDGSAIADLTDIFSCGAGVSGPSRIAWGRDGKLYMTTPSSGNGSSSQDPNSYSGKVLRLNDDGTVPADNPFVGNKRYRPEIFSTGHRNPQGLAVHRVTGAIYETEHGPLGGDELNLILPGRNYGWPAITYGRNYDGSIVTNDTELIGMEQPLKYWVPSIAPSGLAIYTGDRFPLWRDSLFLGAMAMREVGTQLYRVDLSTSPPHIEPMLKPLLHRIRDVRQGPDGLLYLLTDDGSDRLLRLEPASP
jgi:aldose sugar dehydrogenase